MAGQGVNALVDTRAAHSLMAGDTFMKLCRTANRPSLIAPTDTACGLGGKGLDVLGATEVVIAGSGLHSERCGRIATAIFLSRPLRAQCRSGPINAGIEWVQ